MYHLDMLEIIRVAMRNNSSVNIWNWIYVAAARFILIDEECLQIKRIFTERQKNVCFAQSLANSKNIFCPRTSHLREECRTTCALLRLNGRYIMLLINSCNAITLITYNNLICVIVFQTRAKWYANNRKYFAFRRVAAHPSPMHEHWPKFPVTIILHGFVMLI